MYSSVLLFLNIGTPELILIMFVALLLFGGNKLPELARGLGKGLRDFKDASEGVKREIHNQINSYDEPKPNTYENTYNNTHTPAEENHPVITDNAQHVPAAEILNPAPVTEIETEVPVKKDINS